MKIVVTGVDGFVGRHRVDCLHRSACSISDVSRSKKDRHSGKVRIVYVDNIKHSDFHSMTRSMDIVIYLAALVYQPKESSSHRYMSINHDHSIALAKACVDNRVQQFITLSSSHVYEGLQRDFIESRDLSPISPYARSKYEATKALVDVFRDSSTLCYVIRSPLIYGPRVKGSLRMLASLVKKTPLLPFGKATALRSYISINNLCSFIDFLMKNTVSSGVYNVPDSHDLSTKMLYELIAKSMAEKFIIFQFQDVSSNFY